MSVHESSARHALHGTAALLALLMLPAILLPISIVRVPVDRDSPVGLGTAAEAGSHYRGQCHGTFELLLNLPLRPGSE